MGSAVGIPRLQGEDVNEAYPRFLQNDSHGSVVDMSQRIQVTEAQGPLRPGWGNRPRRGAPSRSWMADSHIAPGGTNPRFHQLPFAQSLPR
jgi:hypothetical protein